MKVNDKVPVYIAGQVVAQAEIKEMDNETATLLVPGTLVVMAVATNIVADAPKEETGQVLLTDTPVGGESDPLVPGVEQNAQVQAPAADAAVQPAVATANDAAGATQAGVEINDASRVETTTPDNTGAVTQAENGS
jgi:hypothetical protein